MSQTHLCGISRWERKVETFTAQSVDGTAHSVTVTLREANDPAVFAPNEQQGTVQEDAQLTSQGQLSVTDTDQNEALTVGQAGTRGVYGEFGIDTAGRWRYASDTAVVRHIEADAIRVLPNGLFPLQREVTYWCVSRDANYDPLKAWKAEHGADVVEGWLASGQIITSSAASGMRVISRLSRCTVSNSAPPRYKIQLISSHRFASTVRRCQACWEPFR